MFSEKIFEPIGVIAAAATFLFSLILFYSDTATFWGSLFAAVLAGGLTWVTYMILRVFYLAVRK